MSWTLIVQKCPNGDRIAAKLPNPPKDKAAAALITRYAEMKQLYDALVAGISENAARVYPSEVGWGPVAVMRGRAVDRVGDRGVGVRGIATRSERVHGQGAQRTRRGDAVGRAASGRQGDPAIGVVAVG